MATKNRKNYPEIPDSSTSLNEANKDAAQLVIYTAPKQSTFDEYFKPVIEERDGKGHTYYIGYSSITPGPSRYAKGKDRYIYIPEGMIEGLLHLIWDYLTRYAEKEKERHEKIEEEEAIALQKKDSERMRVNRMIDHLMNGGTVNDFNE